MRIPEDDTASLKLRPQNGHDPSSLGMGRSFAIACVHCFALLFMPRLYMRLRKRQISRGKKAGRTSAKFKRNRRKRPHNSDRGFVGTSAEIQRRERSPNSLLTRSGKKRGRTPKVPYSTTAGRAYNRFVILTQQKESLDWDKLQSAKNVEDIKEAFRNFPPQYVEREFHDFSLILRVVRERKFPKGKRDGQIRFLADSLAGEGIVSPRRSRDICQQQRSTAEKIGEHKILRRELFIECSCGYKGISRGLDCPKCPPRARGPAWDLGQFLNPFPAV